MPNTRSIGNETEQVATKFLETHQVKIITSNFNSRYGEIDLIGLDGEILVFIEVRYRKNHYFGGPLSSITATKQKRIINTSQYYLQKNTKHAHRNMRFDVVAITSNNHAVEYNINWVKNAFTA